MSANKYRPHLVVLPEDRANEEIANGFLHHWALDLCVVDILSPSGGWSKVVERFKQTFEPSLSQYQERRVLLMIDLDNEPDRVEKIRGQVPEEIRERVFILGALTNPEALRAATKMNFEALGEALAAECYEGERTLWSHDLLGHNVDELDRFAADFQQYLFES